MFGMINAIKITHGIAITVDVIQQGSPNPKAISIPM